MTPGSLDASPDGVNWTSLSMVSQPINLMALQNASGPVALTTVSVAPATYTQFRMTWVTQVSTVYPSYVQLQAGGMVNPLVMPAFTIFNGSVTVPAGGSAQVALVLNGAQAILSTPSAPYRFNATGTAYDLGACGSLAGQLVAGGTPTVAGAEVYAETVDGNRRPNIIRRAFADASGNFSLTALPMGSSYFVVAQPNAYQPVASTPLSVSQGTNSPVTLAFGQPVTTGSLTLTINPGSGTSPLQGTWADLRLNLATGPTGPQYLIVRSQTASTLATSQDQVLFQGLAPLTYGVTCTRFTNGAGPKLDYGFNQLVLAGPATQVSFPYGLNF